MIATAEIQTEQSHRYVIEVPAKLTREQWIQKYSPSPPIGTSKLVDCALNGEPWAIAQVADRIDGKAALSVDGVTFTHRYVVEVPAQLSEEEWEKQYSLPAPPSNVQ